MKGLLYKDLCQAKRSCRFIGVAVLIMMGISVFAMKSGSWFMVLYAGMLTGTIPMSLLTLDTTSGWSVYQRTLPLSAEQIVGCKYLVGLCMAGMAGLMAGGSGLLAWVVNGADLPQGIVIRSVALAVLMSLAGNIVLLPLTFRFDQNKARVAYILFICAMAGFMGVFMGSSQDLPAATQSLVTTAVAVAAVVVLALYLLSWRVAVALYPRHEK